MHATIDLHAGLSLNPLLLPDEASKLAFEPPHVIYFHSFEGRRVASTRMSGIAICDCASGSGRLFPRADCTLRSRVYVTYCTRNRCRQDGTKRQLKSLQVCARRRELGLLGLTSMIWPHAAQADSGGSWLSTSAIISAAFTAAVVALGALTLGVSTQARTQSVAGQRVRSAVLKAMLYGRSST